MTNGILRLWSVAALTAYPSSVVLTGWSTEETDAAVFSVNSVAGEITVLENGIYDWTAKVQFDLNGASTVTRVSSEIFVSSAWRSSSCPQHMWGRDGVLVSSTEPAGANPMYRTVRRLVSGQRIRITCFGYVYNGGSPLALSSRFSYLEVHKVSE